MNRSQFEHAVRAAAAVAGEQEVIVIGSQAVHAYLDEDVPEVAMQSLEADIVLRGDADETLADLVDGAIGEASIFHRTFGFYAQGVSIETAILPEGWDERLVRFETEATNGVVAWCLSPEDLWVSKALAGRPKDLEFCRDLLQRNLVDPERLTRFLDSIDRYDSKRVLARSLLDGEPGS